MDHGSYIFVILGANSKMVIKQVIKIMKMQLCLDVVQIILHFIYIFDRWVIINYGNQSLIWQFLSFVITCTNAAHLG